MALARKLTALGRRSRADRLLIGEAILLLALARIAVLIAPFPLLAKWLSRAPDGPAPNPGLAARIRMAVMTGARNVPWNATCLPQAIAAKVMLARRGQGSALHLGATLNRHGELIAHAWLECDGEIVTGGTSMGRMSHFARFG